LKFFPFIFKLGFPSVIVKRISLIEAISNVIFFNFSFSLIFNFYVFELFIPMAKTDELLIFM
jgi:hypothetical protein